MHLYKQSLTFQQTLEIGKSLSLLQKRVIQSNKAQSMSLLMRVGGNTSIVPNASVSEGFPLIIAVMSCWK